MKTIKIILIEHLTADRLVEVDSKLEIRNYLLKRACFLLFAAFCTSLNLSVEKEFLEGVIAFASLLTGFLVSIIVFIGSAAVSANGERPTKHELNVSVQHRVNQKAIGETQKMRRSIFFSATYLSTITVSIVTVCLLKLLIPEDSIGFDCNILKSVDWQSYCRHFLGKASLFLQLGMKALLFFLLFEIIITFYSIISRISKMVARSFE